MRIDNHIHIGIDFQYYLRQWAPYCLDLPRLMLETENSGIDRFVVFPFASYLGMPTNHPEEFLVCSQQDSSIPYAFENFRLMTEIQRTPSAFSKRLLPFINADPLRNPEGQVEYLNRLIKTYPIHGIKIQPTSVRAPIRSLLEQGECILEFARQYNLPFLIHSSIHPEDSWAQTKDILDIAESHQDIRFTLAHACCFHEKSMDRAAELPNTWFDSAAHVIRCECSIIDYLGVAIPSERFKSDYTKPEQVLLDMATRYPGKLIWGSDTPFYTCQHDKLQLQSNYQNEVAALDKLPASIQEEISYTNTIAWLQPKGEL